VVCQVHNGANRRVRAAAAARVAAAEAALAGLPARDPAEALISAAQEADRIAQGLAVRVRGGGEMVATDLAALGEWLDRVGRLARSVVDSRLDERRVRIDERLGGALAEVIRRVVDQLPLTAEQRDEARPVIARELRAVGERLALEPPP
jgi:hypothetical protein